MLSKQLESTLHKAVLLANQYYHEYATYEHLLLSLIEDEDVKKLLFHYKIDFVAITKKIKEYLQNDLKELKNKSTSEAKPTTGFQRIVQRAAIHVQANGKEKVTGIHVLAEFFLEQNSFAITCLKQHNISRNLVLNYIEFERLRNGQSVSSNNSENGILSKNNENVGKGKNNTSGNANQTESALETFCVNLNAKALNGSIDCLIGRQHEIQRTIEILCRRRKNNALLVGEPGVGKTAIAEGLALRIVRKDVPEILKNSIIYSMEIGSLVAGTKYRGDFEEKIRKILNELKTSPEAILFIDEIHTIIGAGSTTTGSLDASNLLKPAFARGEVRCIGSTTFKEYHNHFEKDMALVRRFQKITVTEPDETATINILNGLKKYYEDHHNVKYDESAILAAVVLSERYINDRRLPDKAIDLIDEAGARKKIIKDHSLERIVTSKDIEELVATISNIPNISMDADDIIQLKNLEINLKSHIFGQDEAITKLCDSIKLSKAGLKSPNKPIGSYLFAGSSGVGKTELAKQLAKFSNMELLKFDMSEYSEAHTVSRLLGSPPGYVGYDQGGLLTEEVDKSPHSVVLFDEIEKAHPDIYNLLLQIMDEGKLTDTTGKMINFAHSIIILTTNLGADEKIRAPIGFGKTKDHHKRKNSSVEAINIAFSAEFRNRLDSVIIFNSLTENVISLIIDKNLNELKIQLAEKFVEFTISKSAKEYLYSNCAGQENGARIFNKFIESEIKQKIANEILFGKLIDGGKVSVDINNKNNKPSFKFFSNKIKMADIKDEIQMV